jgi:hypothetical protein
VHHVTLLLKVITIKRKLKVNKIFLSTLVALIASSFVFAQGPGGQGQRRGEGQGQGRQGQGQNRGEGQGQGRGQNQEVSIPVSVLLETLKLSEEQTAKLKSLEADVKVLVAVQISPLAVGELKLTADQKTKLTDLGKQVQEKTRELMQAGDRDGAMALRETLSSKVNEILTADQRKVVAKYPASRMGGRRNG